MGQIQPPGNSRILEVGSGPGFISLKLAKENPAALIVGIDYSWTQVQAATSLSKKEQINNCSFRRANAMDLPFAEDTFDIVVSVGSIKHWPAKRRGLEEIRRVLTRRGCAFIAEADRKADAEAIRLFAERFEAWYVWEPFMKWYLSKVVFGQSLSAKEAQDIAEQAGFSYVFAEKVSQWPFFLMKLCK